ncbi:NADP(H)-dependent aldo-keto reductase [Alkalilimnicola sp. S0819]|uniref:NADP(H)-dependent aldo-keto reductase n=1 Tax=Alkalilimnicola sp. S0819 TaxID=2613922 RepID=UPI0012621674|nr:NADP(H)-dependent aldo-keto reductase [Alkalilimnicola sp. S0819]KAB7623366.1 NADP(H)-dependent aldo-keto reductase [Alkalilimnicola sp. S0819]MPQ16906.1 NADP(H)-dependent aldo-keto reductase [Alkalilimnicola sp. S0819]
MEYRRLGDTDLQVSQLCLGTMTWGEQNSEAEAHEQLDYAVDQGINFIDAAEMYPVPPRAETAGRTEEYLGSWLAARGNRDKLVIASKMTGPGNGVPHIREGNSRFVRAQMREAVHGSLRRLRTDYLDLYQLHWPDRNSNFFGKLGYSPQADEPEPDIEASLTALAELVEEGLIRHIGLSNETPWGVMRFLMAAEKLGLPRVVSVQNPYNLLNRSYEVGLAEVSHREGCGLLAYSPLAFGMLSGKYLGRWPEEARLTRFARFTRYTSPRGIATAARYVEIARQHGLDPAQMALAWVNRCPWLTSNIIGATRMEQLQSNIASLQLDLPDAVLERIEAVHQDQPNPCP